MQNHNLVALIVALHQARNLAVTGDLDTSAKARGEARTALEVILEGIRNDPGSVQLEDPRISLLRCLCEHYTRANIDPQLWEPVRTLLMPTIRKTESGRLPPRAMPTRAMTRGERYGYLVEQLGEVIGLDPMEARRRLVPLLEKIAPASLTAEVVAEQKQVEAPLPGWRSLGDHSQNDLWVKDTGDSFENIKVMRSTKGLWHPLVFVNDWVGSWHGHPTMRAAMEEAERMHKSEQERLQRQGNG